MDTRNFYGQCSVQKPALQSLSETASSSDTDDDDFTLSSEDEHSETKNDVADEQAHAARFDITGNQLSGEGISGNAQETWLPVCIYKTDYIYWARDFISQLDGQIEYYSLCI